MRTLAVLFALIALFCAGLLCVTLYQWARAEHAAVLSLEPLLNNEHQRADSLATLLDECRAPKPVAVRRTKRHECAQGESCAMPATATRARHVSGQRD